MCVSLFNCVDSNFFFLRTSNKYLDIALLTDTYIQVHCAPWQIICETKWVIDVLQVIKNVLAQLFGIISSVTFLKTYLDAN